ncbi:unnamed protein product [Cyprideis torosa]|uniref:Uncharacterized protein n=1 Tax=Cyprideis torosa TaxID=163714 RepID=A0A7R8W889_9CRUS|nr:unnamed protein product [Cyprideis torosa]CAG0884048.1 unnamed protein product [Cyprideis torosa]
MKTTPAPEREGDFVPPRGSEEWSWWLQLPPNDDVAGRGQLWSRALSGTIESEKEFIRLADQFEKGDETPSEAQLPKKNVREERKRCECQPIASLDPEMIGTLPSIVASSAITVAMRGLALHLKVSPGVTSSDPVACLASIVQLPERKQLESTVSHVEGLIARRLAGVTSPTGVEGPASPRALPQKGSGNGEAPEPSLCHGKHNLPDTPTDVTEVEF